MDVVRRLRDAGFQALWAGGCVRDALLGITPKDYDVATNAPPEAVIRLFGQRRTVPVGASFGVVMVLGSSPESGQIEVATFRSDGAYLDGRRPKNVRYSTMEEDALRRDFTINGMFFDPLREEVLDFVGGRDDLNRRIVRAIGSPAARFEEDKLRMLRAVRFTSTFGFELESGTQTAIRKHRAGLSQVSSERISQELRKILADPGRERAYRLLLETGLHPVLFPELYAFDSQNVTESDPPHTPSTSQLTISVAETGHVLKHLHVRRFEPSLAAILLPLQPRGVEGVPRTSAVTEKCRTLKLALEELKCVAWLCGSLSLVAAAFDKPLHVLKPLLADHRSEMLLDLSAAVAMAKGGEPVDADYCRRYLSQTSAEELNPTPLVSGQDVLSLAIPPGPILGELLQTIRREQLDEQLTTRESALIRLRELAAQR